MARLVSADVCLLVLAWLCAQAQAMQALDEESLSGVTAQDGMTVHLHNAGSLGFSQSKWITDGGAAPLGACSGGTANRHACTLTALTITGVDGNPATATATFDAYGGSNPGLAYRFDWNPVLSNLGYLTINTPARDYSNNSIGALGIYSSGHFHLSNAGLFNAAGSTARYSFLSKGDIIYRQGDIGTPELSMGNFELSTKFSTGAAGGQTASTGTIGLTADGIRIAAPYTQTFLRFDLMYHGNPAVAFDRDNRRGILRFGWLGGLANARMDINAGGVGYGTYNSNTQNLLSGANYSFQNDTGSPGNPRSEGINLLSQWDFDSDFAWVIGQVAGSNETQARFSQWRKMATLPASTPMLTMPVTLDVVQNGTGPQGLCLGGGFTSGMPTQGACTSAGGSWIAGGVPASQAAMAALIRDGRLHAYSQKIDIIDPASSNPYSTYDWGVVYTMGKLDADVYFYPEGRNQGVAVTTNSTGLKADMTIGIQSPGFWQRANSSNPVTRAQAGTNWATNTHLMLADTAVGGDSTQQYALGFVNADVLWSARNLYLRVVGSDSGYPQIPGGLWLQTDTGARYQLRGLFGGGNLLDLSNPVGISLMDINISTTRFIFALHPDVLIAGDAPIGFSGLLDLDGSSYLSIGEVGSPQSAYRFNNLSGRIGWRNGRADLVSGQNSADGLPRFTLKNELLFGQTANFGSGGGNPVVTGVGFGTESFGRMAIPAGRWESEITLRIPTN
ncbi:MAG: hypothetical protein ACK4UT_01255 [Moraxellaceae bacterium]